MERYYEDVSYSRWVHRLNAIPIKWKRGALEGDDGIIPNVHERRWDPEITKIL